MHKKELVAVIESLLFVSGDEGLSEAQLFEIINVEKMEIQLALEQLKEEYKKKSRGLQVIEIANTYRLATKPEHLSYIKALAISPIHSGLSQAALETLAIIAYKQPITRIEIEEIRGVKSEKALQSLSSKLLIKEAGRAKGTGRPILYGTTPQFLDHFGLKTIEELPPLPEHTDAEDIDEDADLFMRDLEMEQTED
ncbi:segregation and condensation protein B [Alkalihalobacillus alcalophilus ATCC 27647 = CGMCC 1.3604]|uniref:Segregation and condensation protein B n=1 Tax=Alkalihalobacillus alcalophilus ATCC 27647 = CGMCC 1.3604 TaxID=1218173 RepID=A0A094WLD1_ALKAL|nr:SMC-Scp complex subunit ScpB [Alkalihalobacillus alcalophilus]KGA98569.1 segregation and condensation protein B [Alkalihalobacillus alcalophilus ATCC 27647 = CGMCC 1.3604]MED1560410.1 SMC-Scp complex subunit ScpB [Alkalihalobacillus alcalophilus]THG89168.1 segregation and condensation protein B [Alkalihalobacillus alcalophilus ATCC 27647 = CGMCC 1.3604]